MSGINILNLNKSFSHNGSQLKILNNLSLFLDKNRITVILGKSGCGKTTLLRILADLEKSDSGEIGYFQDYKMSYIFQEHRLMPWLNVFDNISFGLNRDEIEKERIEKLLDSVELSKFSNSNISHLSGGMQQRVSIARALAYRSNYLLMDEPFSALDYFTRLSMQQNIMKLYKENSCGILLVTHNIDEALLLGHKIIILKNGSIESEYSLAEELERRDLLSEEFIQMKKNILKNLEIEED